MFPNNSEAMVKCPFYHADNLERLRVICKRERMRKDQSSNFHLAWQIPFPALLQFAGFPRLRNQQCWAHKGGTGASLSFLEHRDKDGRWIFDCNNPACGITGDQSEFWHQVVERARLQAAGWCLPQACADLLARVESGEIDVRITEFEGASAKAHGHGRPEGDFTSGDGYWEKLGYLIEQKREIERRIKLPKPIGISLDEVILGLFPENRPLMLTNQKRKFHPIRLRDVWLDKIGIAKQCSHISQYTLPSNLGDILGAHHDGNFNTQVSEIKSGIGVLERGTVLASGAGADIGKLVLLSATTEVHSYGVLLDPLIDTAAVLSDGSVTGSIAKSGTFKDSALLIPTGVDAGLVSVALRGRGSFVEGPIRVSWKPRNPRQHRRQVQQPNLRLQRMKRLVVRMPCQG
jgi:hypothetical protein